MHAYLYKNQESYTPHKTKNRLYKPYHVFSDVSWKCLQCLQIRSIRKIQFLNQWYLTFRKKTFFFFFKKNTISWVNECWLVYGNTHGTSLSGFFYRLKVFHNWTFKTKKGGKETEKKKKRERRKMVVFLRWKKSDAWKAEISVKLMT